MVLEQIPSLWAPWATQPSARRSYPESVERWRSDVGLMMPEALKRRPDAERLVDKMLHVFNWESGGDPSAVGDGGIAHGLAQSHYVGQGATPQQQIADAWRLVANNPDQWTDWGEGATYEGKPFGALGNVPYDSTPNGPGTAGGSNATSAALGAPAGARPATGIQGMAARVVQQRMDKEQARQATTDEDARARLEAILGKPLIALPHEREASLIRPPSTGDAGAGLNAGTAGNAGAPDVGDVPYAAGQDDPRVLRANSQARLRTLSEGLGGGALGGIKDFATSDVPYANEARGAVRSAVDAHLPVPFLPDPTVGDFLPGIGPINRGVNAVKGVARLAGIDTPSGGEVIASQVPTTPLDIGLSAPPGTFARAATGGARGAGVGLGIIGDAESVAKGARQAKAGYAALRAAGHTEEEIVTALGQDAVNLAKGGVPSARGVGAATELTGQAESSAARTAYERALEATGDPGAATEAARRAAAVEADATTGLRGRAGALSERMGPRVVGEAAEQAPKTVDDIAATLSAEADRLDAMNFPEAKDLAADVATAAKRLGDPASEIRRQLQQGGGEPDTVNAATNQPALPGMPAPTMAARDAAQIPHESAVSKAGGIISGALGAPRALALSLDWGVVRDLGILGSSRKGAPAAIAGAKRGAKAYLSEESAQATQDLIKGSDLYKFVTSETNFKRPAHFYEYGEGVAPELRVPEMSSLGDNPVSRVVGNLPHVKMSDRALAVQRNVAGLALLESREAELAAQFGQGSERYYREMQSTIDSVNHLRGYSGSKFAKGLGVLNALTSPQQMISRLQVIGDPINMLLRGDTASAKFAAETLMGFASSQTALMAFLKITGDQAGGRWSVNANPLDGDFGQLQIGNSRYDTLAGLGPIIKTGARIAAVTSDAAFDTEFAKNHANVKDLVEQWITNKETPTARLFYDMAKDMKLPDVETLAGLVAPSIAMGIMQDIRENRGANKLLAVPNAAANFIGVGTNTYKNAEDLTNETSVDVTGQKFSEIKDPVERLKVIAQLPADATKGQNNPKAAERQAYEALLKQKGVIEAPPKKEDGTPGETDSEAKKRRAANADVIATLNPDEQVQRWYWEGSDTLPSKDAVDKALGLGVPNRKVKLDQTQRDLTTEQGKAFWQNNGKSIAPYFDDAFVAKTNKALADYYGMRSAEKLPFDQLPLDKQSTVAGQVRQAVREQDPGLDALLAYIGTGGSGSVANGNRRFTVHSEAAAEQLAKLRAKYGSGAAEEGAKFYKPDPTKKVGSVPVDVEKARAAGTR